MTRVSQKQIEEVIYRSAKAELFKLASGCPTLDPLPAGRSREMEARTWVDTSFFAWLQGNRNREALGVLLSIVNDAEPGRRARELLEVYTKANKKIEEYDPDQYRG